jgi:hypothetical protein
MDHPRVQIAQTVLLATSPQIAFLVEISFQETVVACYQRENSDVKLSLVY